ncbi:hypothetical protein A6D6_02703 [Alcanivorax xiamenensis]|uniref:Sialate O-acetylesterase domain-containing protein n=1 Tax=Alcanivorax xiamenensis TaxID=1177156 RepID=A0ABQ6Y6H4_9GAMM|nr:sialate O-acetylesterase [Alcanivorax xiamenensis]KAF0804939.1 hypothetical protein A6D6_02703 [Alcanivorax xiamenensis]
MTTYNTGNPLGSPDPRDLYDNAENLDEAVNSDAETWQDRLGVTRPTLKRLERDFPNAGLDADRAEDARAGAETAEQRAITEASRSESAADAAEQFALAAQAGAEIYGTVNEGMSGTTDGDFLFVAGADDQFIALYRHDPGDVATFISAGPSVGYVRRVDSDLQEIRIPQSKYTGAGILVPLFSDASGRVLIGVDKAAGTVFVAGQIDAQSAKMLSREVMGEGGMSGYIGAGPVYPVLTDASGRVLIGVERDSGNLIGAFPSITSRGSAPDLPLDEPVESRSVNQMLFYGQSLSVGAAAGSVISAAQPYNNITFQGGPRAWDGADWDFGPFKPLVEDDVSPAPDGSTNRKETPCSGAANCASSMLALDGIGPTDHVILSSTAGHGGYRIDQLEKGAAWYPNLMGHISGAHNLEADHALHALCWMQGEQDVVAGTDGALYESKLSQLRTDIESDARGITAQMSPVYMITYQLSYGATTHPGIALAQLSLANSDPHVFLSTPTYHIPHAPDDVHLTAVGYKWIGAYFGRAYSRIVAGYQPQWINPVSATIRGSRVRVRFSVPVLPLVLDVDQLALTTDFGFRVLDDGAGAAIDSVSVDGTDVLIDLAAPPVGAVVVRYGLDYLGAGLSITNGGSGNLRDSSADTISIAGQDYPLWNVCPHFQLSAVILGE